MDRECKSRQCQWLAEVVITFPISRDTPPVRPGRQSNRLLMAT